MKGVVFTGNREIEFQDFPDPQPGEGEVVLEIKASGMCGSDLHVYRSPGGGPAAAASMGLGGEGGDVIAGHEPCGVVIERGAGVPEHMAPTGARVMVHHYIGCGICGLCREGWAQMCSDIKAVYGITGHGAHAPYMKVPAATLVFMPDEIGFAEGAAISCGTGTAFGALRRMEMQGGSTLAVFGQGPVGLSATMLGESMGARVIAVDISSERLALASELGAHETVNAAEVDPIEILHEKTRGQGVDYAIDSSGQSDGRVAAIRSTKKWGTVCFVGEGNDVTIDVSRDMLRKQLTIMGSWTFNTVGQEECAHFIADREIPLGRLLTDHYKLDDAVEAYRKFDTQTTGKGVFDF